MREAALLLVLFVACSASHLKFESLPKTLKLTSASTSQLRASYLAKLNAVLLGLSTVPVPGFDVESDLFSLPRAIAVVHIEGLDALKKDDSKAYKLEDDYLDLSSLDEQLASTFGVDREFVTADKEGITGSDIARIASEQKVEEKIKTKLPDLRDELQQMYRIANAITSQQTKFEKSNAADVYRVTIRGINGKKLTEEDRNNIQDAIDKLKKALSTVYGDQVIVEIVTISNPIKHAERHHEQETVVRRKRAAELSDTDNNLKTWREQLNVYVFTSTDYPAIFAIFAGLTIVLALAVLYTVVGMMSMDPSKDSIIYRMTTTRMKKA
ncbi:hypothetical protein RB195_020338 [Necator americanus]|uniref:Renin receptor-like C-terminal transmembrane spanning segment domain-containing protein n=1 Tax=Necator americanus TaxID=51031 RepID=A0ABR1CKN2_NECAM